MNLYHISADTKGYDVYSDAVVAAESEDAAKRIHPGTIDASPTSSDHRWPEVGASAFAHYTWVRTPAEVTAELIGTAAPEIEVGVICASFHAG